MPRSDSDELLGDERYADAFTPPCHRDTLIPAIERVAGRLTTAEVVALLDAAGVPCAPIADTGQVFTDDHLDRRDFFWDADARRARPGPPDRLADAAVRHAGSSQDAAGPPLGGDTVDVLREAGFPDAQIEELLGRAVIAADCFRERCRHPGDADPD